MGRKRKASVTLPKHVHEVKRPSGAVNYYFQRYRGTPKQEKAIRLPDDPLSKAFADALKAAQDGPDPGKFARFIDDYTGSPHFSKLAQKTQVEYKRYLNTIARPLFGPDDPRDLKPFHLANLRDDIGSEKPAKANGFLGAVGAMFAWGIEKNWADDNPAHHVTRLEGGEYKPWPQETWDLAAAHLRADLFLGCVFGLYTCQRLGDVLAMSLEHVRNDMIGVIQAKTGKLLWIPLHRELKPIVAERRRAGVGKMPLVMSPAGRHFTVDYFHALWSLEMQKEPQCAIRNQGYVFHGLRKNGVIKLFEAGCTEKEVQSISGQSPEMVAHYSKQVDQVKLAVSAIRKWEAQ